MNPVNPARQRRAVRQHEIDFAFGAKAKPMPLVAAEHRVESSGINEEPHAVPGAVLPPL